MSGRNGDTEQILAQTSELYRQHILNYDQSPGIRSMAQNIRKLLYSPTAK